ncbi:MAG: hypothetical protein LUQ65_04655 [Candidatus Helarchaeota archaeon]|nr:hypothetical protein [Candidatus Helarchaeota archaeon]
MSKVIAVVAIIALIIGAFALTFGITTFMAMSGTQGTEKTNVTYRNYYATLFCSPPVTLQLIPWTNVTFTLETDEVIYFSFQAQAGVYGRVGSDSWIQVNLILDGVLDTFAYSLFSTNSTTDLVKGSIGFQVLRTDLDPGFHNVTIAYRGNVDTNYLAASTFFIQWFPAGAF